MEDYIWNFPSQFPTVLEDSSKRISDIGWINDLGDKDKIDKVSEKEVC